MIYKTLQVAEAVLANMPTNYADKLIESVISLIAMLPNAEIADAQRKVLMFVLTELEGASPVGMQPRPILHYKGIVLMAAAFGAMSESPSQEIWKNLRDIILRTVEIALSGMSLYKAQANIIMASHLLFKKVIKLVSTFADIFFPNICDTIIDNYLPGKDEGFTVIITGISLLFNEPLTSQWLQSGYPRLFTLLYTALGSSPSPDTISTFYDLQSKLYESGLAVFSQTLLQTLDATVSLSSSLQDRNASRSVLFFSHLVFSSRTEALSHHSFLLVRALVCGLGTINNNTFQSLSTVINNLKKFYFEEFCQGCIQALASEVFRSLQEKEKERLLYCLMHVDYDTIQPMKSLLSTISNILRGQSTFDALIATEIAISSKNIRKNIIDVEG